MGFLRILVVAVAVLVSAQVRTDEGTPPAFFSREKYRNLDLLKIYLNLFHCCFSPPSPPAPLSPPLSISHRQRQGECLLHTVEHKLTLLPDDLFI